MRPIVNSEEMRYLDRQTIEHFGVPSLVLMERAALRVVESIPKKLTHKSRVLIVCGNGNNGADGLAVARLLYQRKCKVTVLQLSDDPGKSRRSKDNETQRGILLKYGVPILKDWPDQNENQYQNQNQNEGYGCVIDALFGVGLSRNLQGDAKDWVQRMNALSGYKVAVDMPSGTSSDTGSVLGVSFLADMTVTFGFQKLGQALYPGRENCGKLVIADIGITNDSWLSRAPKSRMVEKRDLKGLAKRPARSNKGDFGKALVIAGSFGMAGAAVLCAGAAYRAGCGLVKVCTPKENRQIIQTALPEAILYVYDEDYLESKEEGIVSQLAWADCIALGPGLGTKETAYRIVRLVLEHASCPLVLDADALNILASDLSVLQGLKEKAVLTPHIGEMARLCGKRIPQILKDPVREAYEFAGRFGVTLVLKDAVTVTASENGALYLNGSGCAAMAKAGSGDALTGILTALIAQAARGNLKLPGKREDACGLDEIAAIGAYIHGLAGEDAAKRKGDCSILAGDIIESIGIALSNV